MDNVATSDKREVLALVLTACCSLIICWLVWCCMCRLVSAAEVPSTPNWFANLILLLPAAATAVLSMHLEFLQ